MSEERFDRIEAGLNKLTILHEETRDQVKLIAEGFAATNDRLDAINDRFDATNDRFDGINDRFDATNGRIDSTNNRINRFERSVNVRFDRLETLLTKHDTRITALEKRRPARR